MHLRPSTRSETLAAIVAASLLVATDAGLWVMGSSAGETPLNLFSLQTTDAAASVTGAGLSEGFSILTQSGQDNLARIVGFGPVSALVSQFGRANQVEILQQGSGLISVVEQGLAPGAASIFEADLAQVRSGTTDPFGGVSGNRAFIDQAGTNNRSVVGQFGSDALADVFQRGADNLSSILQSGNDASAFVSQTGERNGSMLRQHDFSVRASVTQIGTDGRSEGRQWDQSSGSELRVYQAGSQAMSDIDQGGVRNMAMLVQWDQSERVSSTIIQDGTRAHARVDQAGEDLTAIVRQRSGEGNVAEVYQAGLANVSEIDQSGDGNQARSRQGATGNRSTIVQNGSGNVAVVTQSAP
ncbi:MAG TPA: hypothetical protein VLJ13_03450 [Brevundimonas sp.]|nr:hypothetical protein [Brevundimonas sp.]